MNTRVVQFSLVRPHCDVILTLSIYLYIDPLVRSMGVAVFQTFVMAAYSTPVDVECVLCKQPYRDPRLLPCLHAFCYECLQKLLDDSTEQQATLVCPNCFEQVPLPIRDLPRHVYLSNNANIARRVSQLKTAKVCENCESEEKACAFCHDCGDDGLVICQQCVELHKKLRNYKKHTVISLDSDIKEFFRKAKGGESVLCVKHSQEVVKYFCRPCEALACNECIVEHSGHVFKPVASILDGEKAAIQSACYGLKQALPRLARTERELTDVMHEVDKYNVEFEREIEEALDAITAAVEKRKHELLEEGRAMVVAKKSRLQIQQEELAKLHISMKLALDTISFGNHSYSPAELLSVEAVVKQACSKLEGQFAKASLVPVASPTIVASVSTAGIITAISSLGSLEEMLPCSPSHSGLVGINTKFPISITKDGKRTLILQTRNSRGEPMGTGPVSVRAWLTDRSGRRVCDADVSNSGDGRYGVTFCLQEAFLGKAHFTANGGHIDGSPCDVMVRDYTKLQKPKLSITTPSKPEYLCVSQRNGDIFVTLDNGNVCIYSSKGVLRSTIIGASLGIKCALGIVVDEEREVVYITCAWTHKIVKARLDGKLLLAVGTKGSGHLQFNCPTGLCQDTAGNIYVADYNNKRVQVLGPDCSYRKELKCSNFARGVAVDFHGNVHIATKCGMEIFNSKSGYCEQVNCGDVAINQENHRFVVDYSPDSGVEVYKQDSSFLHRICELHYPRGVCFDQSGAIFVAEQGPKKVLKYC